MKYLTAVVVMAFGAAGCVSTLATPEPSASPEPTATEAYQPSPMGRSDGGPMLWPLFVEDGSGDPGQGTESLTRIAFLDANDRVVTRPIYRTFDFCMSDGRPMRVAAVRDGGIDMLTLDGTVASTIATTAFALPDGWADQVRCEDNKTVAVLAVHPDDTSADVSFDRRDTFDLVTGERISSDRTLTRDDCPPSESLPTANPPKDYPNDIGGDWAMNDAGTAAINTLTQAVVELDESETMFCLGAGGFLSCSGGVLPLVYDANGALTSFSMVDIPSMPAGCGELDVPYLWATAAGVQGYIDTSGKWLFQQPRYTYLSD